MRGLKLTINGRVVCIAAVPGLHQLQSTIVMGGSFGEPTVEVNGYIQRQAALSEHPSWGRQRLTLGDVVTIEVIDTEQPDRPVKTETIDSSESIEEMNRRIEESMARMRLEMEANPPASKAPEQRTTFCSFCGKKSDEVEKLISGPNVFICNECVGLCNDILTDRDKRLTDADGDWPKRDA